MGGFLGQSAGLVCVVGVLLHGRRQLFHAGGGFHHCRRLLLGARGEINIACGDFRRGARHVVHALTHLKNDLLQVLVHAPHCLHQQSWLIASLRIDARGQIARGDFIGDQQRLPQRLRNIARNAPGDQQPDQHAKRDGDIHDKTRFGNGKRRLFGLELIERIYRRVEFFRRAGQHAGLTFVMRKEGMVVIQRCVQAPSLQRNACDPARFEARHAVFQQFALFRHRAQRCRYRRFTRIVRLGDKIGPQLHHALNSGVQAGSRQRLPRIHGLTTQCLAFAVVVRQRIQLHCFQLFATLVDESDKARFFRQVISQRLFNAFKPRSAFRIPAHLVKRFA